MFVILSCGTRLTDSTARRGPENKRNDSGDATPNALNSEDAENPGTPAPRLKPNSSGNVPPLQKISCTTERPYDRRTKQAAEPIRPEMDHYRAGESEFKPTQGALHQDSTPLVNNLYA